MTLRNCARCETEFSLPPSKAVRARVFCSSECHKADRAEHQISVECARCGKVFQSVKALATRKRFCSKACNRAFYRMGETEQRTCRICQTVYTSAVDTARGHLTCSSKCAKVARARPHDPKSKKVSVSCTECGKPLLVFPSRLRARNFCSRNCATIANTQKAKGTIRSSTFINCDYCGKENKLFKSRQKAYADTFCNMQCYLSSKQSGAERRVAAWLDAHQIAYQRQYKLGHRTVDFWVNGTVIEVNGCYWHACAPCGFTSLNNSQRHRIASDKALATYCNRRGIPLLSLWEHDINADNYAAIAAIRPI